MKRREHRAINPHFKLIASAICTLFLSSSLHAATTLYGVADGTVYKLDLENATANFVNSLPNGVNGGEIAVKSDNTLYHAADGPFGIPPDDGNAHLQRLDTNDLSLVPGTDVLLVGPPPPAAPSGGYGQITALTYDSVDFLAADFSIGAVRRLLRINPNSAVTEVLQFFISSGLAFADLGRGPNLYSVQENTPNLLEYNPSGFTLLDTIPIKLDGGSLMVGGATALATHPDGSLWAVLKVDATFHLAEITSISATAAEATSKGVLVQNITSITFVEIEDTPGAVEADILHYAINVIPFLDLNFFTGPNNNANAGRRGALENRALEAAAAVAAGDIEGAIDLLESLLLKIDGATPPKDWMDPSEEKCLLAYGDAVPSCEPNSAGNGGVKGLIARLLDLL